MSTPTVEGVRLSKVVAALQNCSRSQAEAWITSGAVLVDGRVITDPARRVHADSVSVLARQGLAPALTRWTVLAHVPTPHTWPSPKPEGEGPRLPVNLHKHAPLFPLPSGPVSGLEVWSNDPMVLQRFADRQRPLEAEWMLSVPAALLEATLNKLQSWQVRSSISQRQNERGSLRVITLTPEAPGWLPALAASLPGGQWQLRRQRIGQKSLYPLTTNDWRVLKFGEKF
jgi:23S rRNA pseudouridine2604 synthase